MNDTRFKWLIGCITVIVVAGFYFLPKHFKGKDESLNQNGIGEYVYLQKYPKMLHVRRNCKRLNYKNVESQRYKVEELSGQRFEFCSYCVSDEDFEDLETRGIYQVEYSNGR